MTTVNTSLLQLRNSAKARVGLSSSLGQQSNIPDQLWNDWINESNNEFHTFVVRRDTGLFLSSTLYTVTAGNNTFSLPDAGVIVKGVDRSLNNSTSSLSWIDVPRLQFRDRNIANSSFYLSLYPGVPWVRYDLRGTSVWLTPASSAAALYQLWAYPSATQLTADSDTIPDDGHMWSQYITIDVALKALTAQGRTDEMPALMQMKQDMRNTIATMGSDRDYGEPKQAGSRRLRGGGYGSGWGGF